MKKNNPTLEKIKELKKNFEANMLDGDPVEDCGGAMLSAKEVWFFIKSVYQTAFNQGREEERKKTVKRIKVMFKEDDFEGRGANTRIIWVDGFNTALSNIIDFLDSLNQK